MPRSTGIRAVLGALVVRAVRGRELASVNRRFMQRLVSRLRIRAGEVGATPGELEEDAR
jgi:hypothetical protein